MLHNLFRKTANRQIIPSNRTCTWSLGPLLRVIRGSIRTTKGTRRGGPPHGRNYHANRDVTVDREIQLLLYILLILSRGVDITTYVEPKGNKQKHKSKCRRNHGTLASVWTSNPEADSLRSRPLSRIEIPIPSCSLLLMIF